jgi:hypothetical protein
LPRAELLAADLICARDHVAFVDKEVRRLGVPVTSASAPPSNAAPTANGTIAAPDSLPLARLKQYLEANIPHGLIDVRDPATELPEDHDHDNAPGYIGVHDKKIELWFSNVQFEKIARGKREGRTLKRALVGMGVLMVWGRGNGKVGPLVKRRIGKMGLCWVVAMTPSKAMQAKLPALQDPEREQAPVRQPPQARRSPLQGESRRLHRPVSRAQSVLDPGADDSGGRRRPARRPRALRGATRTRPPRD